MTKLSLAALAAAALTACQNGTEQAMPLDTEVAKQSYSVGVSVGRTVQGVIEDYEAMGISLDGNLIVRGVQDAIAGKQAFTDEEMQALVDGLNQQVIEKQTERAAAEAADTIAAGQAYLDQNAAKAGVTVTESGLQYEVLQAGEGPKPAATDIVKVHYTGTLTDGTVFDSSIERGEPAQFPLDRVIPGWTEGVQLMNVGSKFRFAIPSELAYGEQDMGLIKPGSVLVFDVELLDIIEAPQE